MSVNALFDLTGRVAIVTGGGNGIGKACCELLSQAGAAVVVSDLKLADAETVASGIKAAGGKAVPVAWRKGKCVPEFEDHLPENRAVEIPFRELACPGLLP